MQSVSAAFTAEEKDSVRRIAHNLQVSWKTDSTLSNRTFTIGVSLIGGNDIIGINPGSIGSPGNYRYFDESEYVTSLAWERGLNMPLGGLSKSMAEASLDNTSGRFTPRYMGGNSELHTAIQPRKPIIINAGFEINGVPSVIPQFAGLITEMPKVDKRSGEASIKAADYIDFFQNKKLDQEVMFTGLRTDEVFENIMTGTLGMSTAQFDLDFGINIIPFGYFPKGYSVSDIFHQLAEAENGHIYQDENGIFHFDNRQHWDVSPFTDVQRIILTGQVLNAETPTEDHIINLVEISSPIREKQPLQTIFELPTLSSFTIPGNSSVDKFFEFQDPILELIDPTSGGENSFYAANSLEDGTGTDLTSNVQVVNLGTFAQSVKYRFTNASSEPAIITQLLLGGRVAKTIGELYYREQDDSSVTAYQERPIRIRNDYIQSEDWARSFSRLILNDYSDIENLQRLTIRAIPELQFGDLVSWQGRYWRVFDIKSYLNTSQGFIQELTMLQRTITSYFRIGISTIGGSDQIAP